MNNVLSSAEYNPFIDYMSAGFNSQRQIEIGMVNGLTIPMDRNVSDYNFYTKGKYLNTVILISKKSVNASLDFLLPGTIIFGTCFTGRGKEDCYPAQYVTDLLNGEIGYKSGSLSVGVINEIHPFIFRGFMHVSGLKIAYGTRYQYGLVIYEQDWMKNRYPIFGIKTEFSKF
jgi:hypothetical protein